MKYRVFAKLVKVEPVDHETYVHTYEAPQIAQDALPGQFLHIRVTHLSTPLLRRPISILWSDSHSLVKVLFKVVRTGTALLAEKREGELVDLLGPLGTPFPYDFNRDSIMVAGGYGIAPVYYLSRLNPSNNNKRVLIYGARDASQLYLRNDLKAAFDEVNYATQDGSVGRRGLVTDPLRDLLMSRGNLAIYACGPTPMLAAVKQLVAEVAEPGTPCWLSMENQMGCGFGACQGCVVKTVDGYATTCKQGPVFDARTVVFS
ncbi:MAG: dihydroorotate dehydrogenase electron transfer subunit [Candidatus Sumerlaeaceae bacterium]|nr:dihydroorotate dehydrogenase electron transfer subunit [Candidatus Sumerlaeaceae bacterium]